jgi:aspartate aminotransferase
MRDLDGNTIINSLDVTRALLRLAKVAVSPGLSCGFDDCKVRVSFGCVGASATYAATHPFEASAALRGLSRFVSGQPELVATYRPTTGENLDDAERLNFSRGRSVIREAFVERIAPALCEIILANGDSINGQR